MHWTFINLWGAYMCSVLSSSLVHMDAPMQHISTLHQQGWYNLRGEISYHVALKTIMHPSFGLLWLYIMHYVGACCSEPITETRCSAIKAKSNLDDKSVLYWNCISTEGYFYEIAAVSEKNHFLNWYLRNGNYLQVISRWRNWGVESSQLLPEIVEFRWN